MKREIQELVTIARRAGWGVAHTGGGHLRFKPSQGGPIFTASTPSDRRAVANVRAHLRRAGLDV